MPLPSLPRKKADRLHTASAVKTAESRSDKKVKVDDVPPNSQLSTDYQEIISTIRSTNTIAPKDRQTFSTKSVVKSTDEEALNKQSKKKKSFVKKTVCFRHERFDA